MYTYIHPSIYPSIYLSIFDGNGTADPHAENLSARGAFERQWCVGARQRWP